MNRAARLRRAGLLLAGLLLGVLFVLLAALFYTQRAQEVLLREAFTRNLGLAGDAFQVEELGEGVLRITGRDVVLLDAAGDTVLAAPFARLSFDPRVLQDETAPLVFSDVELRNPFVRLVQFPDESWNFEQVTRVEVAGQEVAETEGRPIVFQNVRVVGGRAVLATPWSPGDTLPTPFLTDEVQLAQLRGGLYRVRTVQGLDARLPLARFGGAAPWRVEVAQLTATINDPDVQIAQLQGWAEEVPDGVRFAVQTLQTGRSVLAGAGTVRTPADQLLVDVDLTANLDFRDLRGISPMLPPEGTAEIALTARTRPDGRTLWAVRDLEVLTLDSRVAGYVTVLTGGDLPPVFQDTQLLLDPLDLQVLALLGLQDQVPYLGQVRGTLSTAGPVADFEGPLRVDLVASIVPRDLPNIPASIIAAEGLIALGSDPDPVILQGLRISAQPLYLAALRPLLPEQEERLRGTLRGGVTLTGTTRAVRFTDGDLAYEVGAAQPTRLTALSGQVVLEPALSYQIEATAQPLALATVAELVPAFPFEEISLFGPIQIAGDAEQLRFGADMTGPAGAFEATGFLAFEDPLRFRVAGVLDAFRPGRLLAANIPFADPISGPFLIEGTAEDFRFDVDLQQALGRFALAGRVQLPEDTPPIFEAEGEVFQFQLGALIGRPGLLPSPVSGDLRVSGGGFRAYTFDVDLRGPGAVLDVEGWYDPRGIGTYALSGTVEGLNLHRLPGFEEIPPTVLTGTLAVDGQGTTLDTFAGRLELFADRTIVGGLPLEAARAQVTVQDGIVQVDNLLVGLRGTRLEAAGMWGLTQPAPEPLRYSLVSPNLAALTPVLVSMGMIEPQLEGSLNLQGWVAGTLERPSIAAVGTGRGLRYNGWRAANLTLDVDIVRQPDGWAGEATVLADNVLLAGAEAFQTVRLEAVGGPETVAVGLLARRDRTTEVALSGTVVLDELTPQGFGLESMTLLLEGTQWQLAAPTQVRWGEVQGMEIDNLVLRRLDGEGWVELDGRLPPTGVTDFTVRVRGLDLGDIRTLVRGAPALDGVLTLDARLEGPVTAPELDIQARVDGLRLEDATAETVALTARYADGRMVGDAAVWMQGLQVATATATVPMQLSIEGLVPSVELLDAEPMSARIVVDSLPTALVVAAVPQARDGAGVIAAEIDIRGTPDSPEMSGWAAIRRGALTIDALGARYREINGRLVLDGDIIHVESLTARSGGVASITGFIRVDDPERPSLNLGATFNQFRAMAREDVADIAISGQASITGAWPTPTLSGRLMASDGTIAVPGFADEEQFEIADVGVGIIGEDVVPEIVLEPTLVDQIRIMGLEVVIGEGVWAVSPELRVQLAGELLVSRFDPETWQVFGELETLRGRYTLRIGPLTREFDVERGQIRFFGTPDLNPDIDILASHRVRSAATSPEGGRGAVLNILVEITGTAQFLRLNLTSDTQPPLPESEILSYLIFGRPTFALGEVGVGLAQQVLLEEIAGGLLATQLEQLLQQAGLPFDYVRVRGRPSPAELGGGGELLGTTTIEVGWEVTRNVFWTVEWGVGLRQLGDTWGTSLEWQIDPQWSARIAWEPLRRDLLLQRMTGIDRQFSAEVRRRWEYGHPRTSPALLERRPGTPVSLFPPPSWRAGAGDPPPDEEQAPQ